MKYSLFKKSAIARNSIFFLFAIEIFILTDVHLQAKDKMKQPFKLDKSLIGAWVLVGAQDNNSNPSGVGSRLQFFTGKHWVVTQADPTTGEVVFHLGGTYSLKSDELIKSIVYANSSTAALIKQSHKFAIKIERDTLTQVGIGNQWNEIWVRAR